MKYYLAIDIGASSGRHILGSIDRGKLALEEVYRFPNGLKERDGHIVWDVQELFGEIIAGMKKCADIGKIPVSLGIDTWAVDYVLLDADGRGIPPAYAYRDRRGSESVAAVEKIIPFAELYSRTGIQKQPFNTIYQLWWDKERGRLGQASGMLMLPEYFNYLLTGKAVREYTNSTSTGLINACTGTWDREIISAMAYPERLFDEIHQPGDFVGGLLPEIRREAGFDCAVVLPGTHDTASAVAACPGADGHALYISSGTWSLMGTELDLAMLDGRCMAANFTNEGGVNGKIRFLKNIMGLWMIQQIKHEQKEAVSYEHLMNMAQSSEFAGTVDVQSGDFLAPRSMLETVRAKLGRPELPLADVMRSVYHSLALCYAQTAREIEQITGREYGKIYIFGGGCSDGYLNELTELYSRKRVVAGPKEATAIGNILVQLLAGGEIRSIQEGRRLARESCV
ncbi:MAG: rhamnulokinase [Oscillospiraceae bacterium]|jgi:rhamnulokinase|nr:rhamnulokinase [Oscillospiraceae bacterium]